MFSKVLVANRGEIALRIVRACRDLGVRSVVTYSEPDRESLAVALADEAVCIGPAPSDRSYLNIPNVVSAALVSGADAIHPGYGFLSENAYLAEVCEQIGLTFIGPPIAAIEQFGDKVAARHLVREAGVPIVPGSEGPIGSLDQARVVAAEVGYPLMLKAVAGGGGRGMRLAREETELERAFPIAQMEAQSHFANGAVYLERLVEHARHVEIQLVADRQGNTVHLGERECSIQRRHQKILEEAPSPAVAADLRRRMGEAAVIGARAAGYYSVGTMEFLLDRGGNFYFIEMNCRIQVEHPITELVTGYDLVKEQIRVAAGEQLNLRQEDVAWRGHAIECRINAEDVERDFAPDSGLIETWLAPGGPGVRVDSHLYPSYTMPPYYDSLLAKLAVWGRDRSEAVDRMRRALRECRIAGVKTNIPFHLETLHDPTFLAGQATTHFVAEKLSPRDSAPATAGLGCE
jgi:acetyl-CoA carboxylase biotin carboxylase subunit